VRAMKVLVLAAIGSMIAIGSASADMMLTGGPSAATATGEGYSLTHYLVAHDPSSAITGSSQEYLLTSFSQPIYLPDPQNYGLQISKGFAMTFPGVDVWDLGTDIGDADWALSYYSPEPATFGNPFHSVMYGSTSAETVMFDPANDGPGGVVDIAYGSATLTNDDGLYHTVGGSTLAIGIVPMQLNVTLYEVGITAAGQNEWSTTAPAPVPEPTTGLLLGLGLLALMQTRTIGRAA